jgi:hypothetical protein
MPLAMPETFKQALTQLCSLSVEERSALSNALSSVKPTFFPLDKKAVLSQIPPDIQAATSDLEDIITVIVSLYGVIERTNLSQERLAEDVVSFIADQPDFNAGNRDLLTSFLTEILSKDALTIVAKASDVIVQHENPLRSARILTDLRPIFSAGEDPKISAGMIVHNLQLSVGLSEEPRFFFVALDTNDIRKLKKEIDMALRKESEIKDLANSANINYIDANPNFDQ